MKLYEWGLSVPWCITQPALDLMLSLAAREEVDEEALKQAMHGPTSLALRNGQRREDSPTMRTIDGVARIPIDGPIYRYASFFTRYSGGVTTEALAKDFQSALDDPTVGAILFVIDSPGGEGIGIGELADTIYASRGRKPIGAYIEGYGASAAYWIASAADVVVTDASALVGSIGTIFGVPDPAKRASSTITIVSSQSPKKRVDVTTHEGRAVLQRWADELTEVFISRVMRNRGITREQILAIEGDLRIGQLAIEAGLADKLGAEDLIIRELATRATGRAPFTLPPARLPGGSPLRMEARHMNWKEFWGGLFQSAAEVEGTQVAAALEAQQPSSSSGSTRTVQLSGEQLSTIEQAIAPLAPAQSSGPDPREERIASLERQLAEQREQQIQVSAAAFADGAIRGHQAYPAERATLIKAYASAAHDDARDPWPAPKSEGEAASRVALLESQIAARPAHSLESEQVRVGEGGVLESGAVPLGLSDVRRQKLLNMTPTGQAALRRKRHGAA